MDNSYLVTCGVCCIYPIVAGAFAIFGYRRYQIGGWRAIFFGTKGQE